MVTKHLGQMLLQLEKMTNSYLLVIVGRCFIDLNIVAKGYRTLYILNT